MDIFNLFFGLFMIGLGFLVKAAPNLIAGYNTLPKEKKANIDIAGLSTYMRNSFIIIGLTIIIGYYSFKWMGFTLIADSLAVAVTIVGVSIMVINAQRFDKNKGNKSKLAFLIPGIVLVFVAGLLAYGFIPSKAIFSDNTVRFTGMYGFEMNISDIDTIELEEQIPGIRLRTNGFSFGSVNKGEFKLDQWGKCRLLLHSDKPPYLIISENNGGTSVINFKDEAKTKQLFDEIKTLIDSQP